MALESDLISLDASFGTPCEKSSPPSLSLVSGLDGKLRDIFLDCASSESCFLGVLQKSGFIFQRKIGCELISCTIIQPNVPI